ncbi:MAG: hypothetical protein CL609_01615 [Anaerolineaceae bacterium]|nr:hypothetical protein [Anaerolineaceae bacterium]
MKTINRRFILCILLICCFVLPTNQVFAKAESGTAAFQLGTTLYEQGPQMDYALRVLQESSFDLVAIEVNWAEIQPEATQTINTQNLDLIIRSLQTSQQKLFIRLVNAPDWALSPTGPDIQSTIQCISQIINLYPIIQAVEVFPGANIENLWGTAPSAEHYMRMLSSIADYFSQNHINTLLIVGGFLQLNPEQGQNGILDLNFLQSMYDYGFKNLPAVVSVQFENIEADPEMPATSQTDLTMRHYELVRQVMINNVDQNRLMWVTKLTPPQQKDGPNLLENQAQWMEKALTLIRSQLYIQVCILQPINPEKTSQSNQFSLIKADGTLNPIINIFPFYSVTLNNPFSNNVLKLVQQKQNLPKMR